MAVKLYLHGSRIMSLVSEGELTEKARDGHPDDDSPHLSLGKKRGREAGLQKLISRDSGDSRTNARPQFIAFWSGIWRVEGPERI